MKPKILIFSLGYYPKHIGGAEVAIKEITERLGNDYEFHVLCNRYDSTLPVVEEIGNVTVHRIGFATPNPSMTDLRKLPLHLNKILYQFSACWHAKRLHKKHNFDLVWGMMAHATGVPAGKFKRAFPDVGYVLTLQEGDPPEQIEQKMRIFGQAFTDGFLRADTIQVISRFLGSWAKRKGYSGPIIHIPNAVDIKHFSGKISTDERARLRAELGLESTDIALVTTSRLVHKNAVDDVIRSLHKLPNNVKFVVFGTGPDEAMLRNVVTELHLQNRVQFRGHIGHDVLPLYLKACDIFIRPSRSEGMGNSFVEAMSAGVPVIATQEGGIADFLFDEVRNPDVPTTGWAVDANAPEQIARVVLDITSYPEKTKHVVETARILAERDYDWDLIANRMKQEVFEPVLNRNK